VNAREKPHDVGNGLVCGSFGNDGRWLSLATVDPGAGFVELNGLPVFDPELRGDVDAVRRYRSWMRRDEHAFLHLDVGRATISTRQDAPKSTRGIIQRLVVRAPFPDRPSGIRIRFNGRVAPPAYAEITEVDPPGVETDPTTLRATEGSLRIEGDGPSVVVQVWQRQGEPGSAEGRADARVSWELMQRRMPTAIAWIDWPEDANEVHLDIACTFDQPALDDPDWLDADAVSPPEDSSREGDGGRPLRVPTRLVRPLGRMNQRAASYVRSCTALQAGPGERVMLADHRILPLSWTRDAYWQARLLLATWTRGGHDDDVRIVADHLRWLFLKCERPEGRWVRSHYADGRQKDHPFQADQQLYPLLELADFAAATGELPDLPPDRSWGELVTEAWSAAETAIDESTGFIATTENAADDVPEYPFLVADQVLLWHVATRLSALAPKLEVAKGPFATHAETVRLAVKERFVVEGPLGRQWAYAINVRGGSERYMDANDLPVFLAPLWGFCKASDAAWRTTVEFAFDAANPGFVPGAAGGLGSRHTPGTWTLGDISRWVSAGLLEDTDTADGALARLVDVAYTDGMLPEAYDPEGSGSSVRHWFAWPGAALGSLLLANAARTTGE
jgi:hypothetical protein